MNRQFTLPGNVLSLFLCGGLLGLTALLSPALLPAGALMVGSEFAAQRLDRRRVFLGSLLIGVVATLVISPWILRNYRALGGFVPLRSNFGLELAIGNNPLADGKTFSSHNKEEQRPLNALHPFSNPAERARLVSVGELAYMREKQRDALRYMSEHPAETMRLTLARTRHYWFPKSDMWSPRTTARHLKSLIYGLVGAGALLNLVYLAATKHDRTWLFAAALIGPSLVYLMTHIHPRYCYPTFGICTLLAFDLLESVRRRSIARPALSPGQD